MFEDRVEKFLTACEGDATGRLKFTGDPLKGMALQKITAEKVGFRSEGMEREMIQWQGRWHSLVHYGMLREEWERLHRDCAGR